MRPALLVALSLAVALVGGVSAWLARAETAQAQEISTLYMSGFEIGPGHRAVVRLRNTSTRPADTFNVIYVVRDPRAGVPISRPGAGGGALLRAGETVELDLGEIVDLYREELEAGPYAGPVQFVAFGTGGQFSTFGPDVIVAEGLQRIKRAEFGVAVDWVTE